MSAVLLLLLVAAARAQGVPDPEAPPVSDAPTAPLTPAPALAPVPLADRMVWEQRARPPTRAALEAVAVSPGEGRVWLTVAADGAVFRSPDAGASWSLVLPGAATEVEVDAERVLLDAERARDEQREDVSDVVDSETPSAETDVEVDLSNAGAEGARVADRAIAELQARAARERAAPSAWFDPDGPDVALVGRVDGLWRTTDGGQSWTQVLPEVGVRAFLRAGPTVVGAGDGLRVSLDAGETWIQIEGPLSARSVRQLADVGGVLFAAADDGLWRSSDAFHWERLPAPGLGAVLAVVADPDWAGGLWMSREDGLYRSDDGAVSFYLSGRQPMEEIGELVHLGEAGHLLAASRVDGVWESLDGGTRWQPVVRLLSEPRVNDLALLGRRPVIATPGGLWELVAPTLLADDVALEGPEGLSLGDAVSISLRRAGLDLSPASLVRRAAAYRLTPKLIVGGYYATRASRDAEFLAEDTVEGHDRVFLATAQICWGTCDTLITYSFGDDLEDLVADELVDPDLYVLDGEVYVDDDSLAPVAGAANVAQAVSRYRINVAEQVSDAWLARRRLAADGVLPADAPLREQVLRVLQLAELDARLDAFTGGAFSQSLRSKESPR